MNQCLILTVLGNHAGSLPEKITKAIHDNGGSITQCRLSKMGRELGGLIMVEGNWDAIAKIEALLPKLQADLKLQMHGERTEINKPAGDAVPYGIDIVCRSRPGILYQVSRFMSERDIEIHDLHTVTQPSPQTGAAMFTLHMAVNVPATASLSALRGDFMDFCDSLNLDAIMEPIK